jgi:hypothetical protein
MARSLPPHVWSQIKTRAEAGERLVDLSRDYGVSESAIRSRSIRGKWLTPGRRRSKGESSENIERSNKNELSAARSENGHAANPPLASGERQPADTPATLASAADRLRRVIVESLPRLEATENPRELVTLIDSLRRIEGLDKGQPAGGLRLRAPRSIGRPAPLAPRPAPADPPADPPQGFRLE